MPEQGAETPIPEPTAEELEAFTELFSQEFEFMFEEMDPELDGLSIAPIHILVEDDRVPEEMHQKEREAMYGAAFEAMGITRGQEQDYLHRTYRTAASYEEDAPKDIEVRVYETTRSQEGLYLHAFHHPDGGVVYYVGRDEDL